jgi:hypothetical protein
MMMALLKYLDRGSKGDTKISKIIGDLLIITIVDQTKAMMEISQRNKLQGEIIWHTQFEFRNHV